ncbi:MAG: hypothetical protein IT372_20905 [Polyangiaceae bacterium]|nr:hypothetical protein [Polyangiaceae bacterium]
MLKKGPLAALAAALALAAASCGGSKHNTADSYWSSEPHDEGTKPLRETQSLTDSAPPPTPLTTSSPLSSWVGVRHDLSLAPSPARKEACSCLAVEVGPAADPRFQWAAGAPDIGGEAVAVALSARGVPCPGGDPDEEKRRPSISAVDQEGNDVIVEVEELPPGRPLATGAVIPKPAQGGAIYIKGRTAKVPYARAGQGLRCKVY